MGGIGKYAYVGPRSSVGGIAGAGSRGAACEQVGADHGLTGQVASPVRPDVDTASPVLGIGRPVSDLPAQLQEAVEVPLGLSHSVHEEDATWTPELKDGGHLVELYLEFLVLPAYGTVANYLHRIPLVKPLLATLLWRIRL